MKHELTTTIFPDFYVKTGSSSYQIFKDKKTGKQYKTVAYSGGFGWLNVFRRLNKYVPLLEQPTIYEGSIKPQYGFANLYQYRVQDGDKIIKYDIKKAYKTILSVFWKNWDNAEMQKTLKAKKSDFNKAVGYCGYHKTVINAYTGEQVEVTLPQRPDILYFCVRFLSEYKKFLQGFYKQKLAFVFVDSFGFNTDIDYDIFLKISADFQESFYKSQGVLNKNYNKLDFHKDVYNVKKNGYFVEFYNDTEHKKYFTN